MIYRLTVSLYGAMADWFVVQTSGRQRHARSGHLQCFQGCHCRKFRRQSADENVGRKCSELGVGIVANNQRIVPYL
jgi:hypothetical protein